MVDIVGTLKKTDLLAAVPEVLLGMLAQETRIHSLMAGEFLFKKGDVATSLFFVTSGEMEVVHETGNGHNFVCALIGSGQSVGEMGLIDDQPRSASIRAGTDAMLLEVSNNAVIAALMKDSSVFLKTLQTVSRRLRETNNSLEEKYHELITQAGELKKSYQATIMALSKALEIRDRATSGHSERVTAYSIIIGKGMGLSMFELEELRMGVLLHDLGKIGVSDTILHKDGKLTDSEWEKMREHPALGKGIVGQIEFLRGAMDVIYGHHEKWDGTGYPQKLAGTSIPMPARIFAVADVFDALTMERSYKSAWSTEDAKNEIIRSSSSHFDPSVVSVFSEKFPLLCSVLERSKAGQPLDISTVWLQDGDSVLPSCVI